MKKFYLLSFSLILLTSLLYSQSGWFPVFGDTNAAWQWNYFTDANTGYAVGYKQISNQLFPRVIKTTNAGSTWTEQMTPQRDSANFFFRSVYFVDMNTGFIAAAYSTNNFIGRILKTTNGGNNWFTCLLPIDKHLTSVFFVNSATGYVSGLGIVLKTSNTGSTWEIQNPNYSFYLFQIHFLDVNTGYICGNQGTVIKTTNGGNNWQTMNTGTTAPLWGLKFADANTGIAAGGNPNNSSNIIIRTTDAGNNWSVIPYSYSTCLLWSVNFINSTTGFIIGWCSQVLKTTNGGLNWYNQLVPESNYWGRSCYFINANTGYLAGEYNLNGDLGRIYKTTDGGGNFVGINENSNEIPNEYRLFQNYPNPFNPKTIIKFQLSIFNDVRLVISDVLGKEIETLMNNELNPGTYEVSWDASNYPSGVYYYKLTAGKYTVTKKMVLVK